MFWRRISIRQLQLFVPKTGLFSRHFSTNFRLPKRVTPLTLLGRGCLVGGVVGGLFWSCSKGFHARKISAAEEPSVKDRLNMFADLAENVAPAVVCLEIGTVLSKSSGSGFFVQENGLILTSFHVVDESWMGQKPLIVKLSNGTKFKGTVVAVHPQNDLALVKISVKDFPVVKLADYSQTRAGEFVMAIGCPFGLKNTLTFGVISSTRRLLSETPISLEDDVDPDLRVLQTDLASGPGGSGGPVFNLDGEVIGLIVKGQEPGITFAVPSDYAWKFLEEAKIHMSKSSTSTETFLSGWIGWKERLGVSIIEITPEITRQLRSNLSQFSNVTQGVLVEGVYSESPAFRCGLEPGDIIMDINGNPAINSTDVFKALEEAESVKFSVLRDGRTVSITAEMK